MDPGRPRPARVTAGEEAFGSSLTFRFSSHGATEPQREIPERDPLAGCISVPLCLRERTLLLNSGRRRPAKAPT